MGTAGKGCDDAHVKMTIKQVIVVEGKYDAARVRQVVRGTVVAVGGFQIYRDRRMLDYLRRAARQRGVIILTDSDAAGFKIRGYLKGALQNAAVSHAYIPAAPGKERRKTSPSAEGLLGVEGMPGEVILEALRRAGATPGEPLGDMCKADLYAAGLLGCTGSAERRRALARWLDLPPRLSSTALLDAINLTMTRETFTRMTNIGFDEATKRMV